ncbi:MAG: phytanoyl-CoA dioxygenase family protein [Acidimicrobiales bacterium]|nr:phytanoyl-CoA dioxygenase family protein [Acidimicrobiales bacterium]
MSLTDERPDLSDRSLDTAYPITGEQVRSLHQDSWASIPGLLDLDTVEKLRDALLAAEPRTTISGPDKPPADPNALLSHEGVAWRDPFVRSVATSRRLSSAVVGLLEQLDAVFCQDISFFKPEGARAIPYHQDYSYWPFDRKGCVTLWIALVDMTPEMGPLRYLKGSHLEGPLGLIEQRDIRDAYPHLADNEIVGGKAMKAGDAQAHWELTLHGSRRNDGPGRREAVAFRYIRSDTIYIGLTHPHYDQFGLAPGKRFVDNDHFPHLNAEGLIDPSRDDISSFTYETGDAGEP